MAAIDQVAGQEFRNGSYVMFEVPDGEDAHESPTIGGVSAQVPMGAAADGLESWYAVAGGPKAGVHRLPRKRYHAELRPHIDGVRDLFVR